MTEDRELAVELLPCPFCGGEAEVIGPTPFHAKPFVECVRCEIGTKFSESAETATKIWNTRYDAGRSQWVAVADRLPEENGIYAVVIPHGGDETTVTYDAYHAKHGTWTHYRGHIAWMPIPPFESGKEQG